MSQQQLSKWLRVMVIGMGFCGVLLYAWLIPNLGRGIVYANPEFASWYAPWLVAIWITAGPCYLALGYVWQLGISMKEDQSFTQLNAKRLKRISQLAAGDAAYFFLINCIYLLMGRNHPGVFLIALILVFIGIAFAVVAAALSHLISKASDLREENDGTI